MALLLTPLVLPKSCPLGERLNIKKQAHLGSGLLGMSYRAVASNSSQYVVKLFKSSNHESEDLEHPSYIKPMYVGPCTYGEKQRKCQIMKPMELSVQSLIQMQSISYVEYIALGFKIGLAIKRLHDEGLYHLNLKPTNIFIENGKIFFTDHNPSPCCSNSPLTLIRIGCEYSNPANIIPNYDKPERADVYAFGLVLYYMYTGNAPFKNCLGMIPLCVSRGIPPVKRFKGPEAGLKLVANCCKKFTLIEALKTLADEYVRLSGPERPARSRRIMYNTTYFSHTEASSMPMNLSKQNLSHCRFGGTACDGDKSKLLCIPCISVDGHDVHWLDAQAFQSSTGVKPEVNLTYYKNRSVLAIKPQELVFYGDTQRELALSLTEAEVASLMSHTRHRLLDIQLQSPIQMETMRFMVSFVIHELMPNGLFEVGLTGPKDPNMKDSLCVCSNGDLVIPKSIEYPISAPDIPRTTPAAIYKGDTRDSRSGAREIIHLPMTIKENSVITYVLDYPKHLLFVIFDNACADIEALVGKVSATVDQADRIEQMGHSSRVLVIHNFMWRYIRPYIMTRKALVEIV